MIRIKAAGAFKAFDWTFVYPHVMHKTTESIMYRPTHPLRNLLEQKFREGDKTTLWTYVYSAARVSKKAFIRQHHSRRIRHAIMDALKDIGLDKEGRPLVETELALRSQASPIMGCLSIIPKEPVLNAEYQDLVVAGREMMSKIRQASSKPQLNLRPQRNLPQR
jgi:hypothetical protein